MKRVIENNCLCNYITTRNCLYLWELRVTLVGFC